MSYIIYWVCPVNYTSFIFTKTKMKGRIVAVLPWICDSLCFLLVVLGGIHNPRVQDFKKSLHRRVPSPFSTYSLVLILRSLLFYLSKLTTLPWYFRYLSHPNHHGIPHRLPLYPSPPQFPSAACNSLLESPTDTPKNKYNDDDDDDDDVDCFPRQDK